MMAQIEKRGKYQWRARVRKQGHQQLSKTFNNKKDAEAWARSVEADMDRGSFINTSLADKTLLSELLDRYGEQVCPTLSQGGKPDLARLKKLKEGLGSLVVGKLESAHIATYRDKRLAEKASAQSVKHELGLLNRVLKLGHTEWNYQLPNGLPTMWVKKPKVPRGRDRRLDGDEEKRLMAAAEEYGGDIGAIIAFAIETAMRRSEIVGMDWKHVDLKTRVVRLEKTKTDVPRTVPLSTKAYGILKGIKTRRIDGLVWSMKADSVTQAFSRVSARAEIEDLRFHDLRHEATSRLFEKGLGTSQVSAITGHQDLSMLKRYTHLRGEDLVEMLG